MNLLLQLLPIATLKYEQITQMFPVAIKQNIPVASNSNAETDYSSINTET